MKDQWISIVIVSLCVMGLGCDDRVSGPVGDDETLPGGGAPFAGNESATEGDDGGETANPVLVACGFVDSGCDDEDPCTVNDSCGADGVCQGEPVECNDEVACTHDVCEDGSCVHTVIDEFCLIAKNCWSDGQSNPSDVCEVCLSSLQPETWSLSQETGCGPGECAAHEDCDDGDPCTVDTCAVGGECVNTPLEGACPEQGCTAHADCDDADPCTQDTCGVDGICVNTLIDDQCGSVECTQNSDCPSGGQCVSIACINNECVEQALSGVCDDGDSCTTSDVCNNGGCEGTIMNCDDGNPCTSDVCSQGSCVHIPQTIEGSTEICGDGLDNDCNGLTDGADPACESDIPTACSFQEDCYPEQICGFWPTFGDPRCSDPCAGPQECASDLVCAHVPGSANLGYCRSPFVAAGLSMGQLCNTNGDCQSEICAGGKCGYLCGDEPHCDVPAHTCYPGGDANLGFNGVCGADSTFPGGKAVGQSCSNSAECLSSHCDLISLQPKCAPLCSADSECNLEQECGLILRSGQPIGETIPFAAVFTTLTYDAILGCFARPTGANGAYGTGDIGTVCVDPIQCRSNKCFALMPGDNTMWCTSYCSADIDCPAGMQCKPDVVNLASNFLVADNSALQTGYTVVRICKWQ